MGEGEGTVNNGRGGGEGSVNNGRGGGECGKTIASIQLGSST